MRQRPRDPDMPHGERPHRQVSAEDSLCSGGKQRGRDKFHFSPGFKASVLPLKEHGRGVRHPGRSSLTGLPGSSVISN